MFNLLSLEMKNVNIFPTKTVNRSLLTSQFSLGLLQKTKVGNLLIGSVENVEIAG